jgi:hypothetical protein
MNRHARLNCEQLEDRNVPSGFWIDPGVPMEQITITGHDQTLSIAINEAVHIEVLGNHNVLNVVFGDMDSPMIAGLQLFVAGTDNQVNFTGI